MTAGGGGRDISALTDTLDAPLEELLDAQGAGTLLSSFYRLFRIPARVFSESGTILARSGDEPELHRRLGQDAASAQQLGLLFVRLREIELGESGERLHRSFTGACYHVVAVGHGGRRLGRAVLGPFVEGNLSSSGFHFALQGVVDQETCNRLAAELPRAKSDTVRSIGRHLVTSLGLFLHESHQALLSARMHLASMKESQREAQRQQHLASLAQEESVQAVQARCAVVAEVLRELQTRIESLATGPTVATPSAVDEGQAPSHLEVGALCRGLVEIASLIAGQSSLQFGDCSPQELGDSLAKQCSDSGLEVKVDVEEGLPELRVDRDAIGRSVCHLAQRVRPLGATEQVLEVALRPARMESTEASVGALMFLEPATPREVELRVNFLSNSTEKLVSVMSALSANAAASAQGAELEVTIARRLIEAHGGTVSLLPWQSGTAAFSLLLPC